MRVGIRGSIKNTSIERATTLFRIMSTCGFLGVQGSIQFGWEVGPFGGEASPAPPLLGIIPDLLPIPMAWHIELIDPVNVNLYRVYSEGFGKGSPERVCQNA